MAFKKTFLRGFEQQPALTDSPKIPLLNAELELKSEKENAEIRLTDPAQYQEIVEAGGPSSTKLDKCVESGAQVVLRGSLGDLATQSFGPLCSARVCSGDMHRVAFATGGMVQS